MTTFFIHYVIADLAWAEWIAWQLEEAGNKTIFDKWHYQVGNNLILKTNEAINKAQKVIVVLSPDYVKAMDRLPTKDKKKQYEWTMALTKDYQSKNKDVLLPVFIRRCKISGLLAARTYIDLADLEEEQAKIVLLENLSKTGKPINSPIFPSRLGSLQHEHPSFPGRSQLLEPYTSVEKEDNVVTEIFKDNFSGFSKSFEWVANGVRKNFLSIVGKGYVSKLEYHYKSMRIFGMNRPIQLRNIYTQVNILEKITSRYRTSIEELDKHFDRDRKSFGKKQETIEGIKAINKLDKCIVLGKPGAGKTTFLKYILLQALDKKLVEIRVPIFVVLKNWSDSGKSLVDFIISQFDNFGLPDKDSFIKRILNTGKCIILLDGLDELSGSSLTIDGGISQIVEFVNEYNGNRFIISCRIAAYNYCFDNFTDIEIADFTDSQIQIFINNWFNENTKKAKLCWRKIKQDNSIKELATIPLLLTMLCLTFDENMEFPLSKAELYRESLDALLRKWDSTRNIKRDEIYRHLSLNRKESLFSRIAEVTFKNNQYFFLQRTLEKYIAEFIKNLPGFNEETLELDSEIILKSIEAQHGILVERAKGIYSFSHLTFQEYFTAKFIAERANSKILTELVENHFSDSRWREVFIVLTNLLEEADELVVTMKKQVDSLGYNFTENLNKIEVIVLKNNISSNKETLSKNRAYVFVKIIDKIVSILTTNTKDLLVAHNLSSAHEYISSLTSTMTIAQSLATKLAKSFGENVQINDDISAEARGLANMLNLNLAKELLVYFRANQLLLDCVNGECYINLETKKKILNTFLSINN